MVLILYRISLQHVLQALIYGGVTNPQLGSS